MTLHTPPDREEISRSIIQASAIIIAATIVDKILAIVKEMLIADRFGISSALDIFNIAYALPGIIMLIFTGALGQAFIPLYHEWMQTHSSREADVYAASLLQITTLFFGILTAAVCLLSPVLFPLIGYGFGAEAKSTGIACVRLLSFLIVLDGAGIILAALLQANKNFLSLQTAPLFINSVMIIMITLCPESMGIQVLIWGIVTGTAFKILFMALVLKHKGFRYLAPVAIDRNVFAAFLWLALPLLGSELLGNVNLLVDQIMATGLSSGSVSSLRYAFRLHDMPVQIIIFAFSKALFPFISQDAGAGDMPRLKALFHQSMVLICLITFPITGCVVVLSHDLVALLFQRGAFGGQASLQTAQILICYSLGLFFHAFCIVGGIFFAALKDTKPLLYTGILSVILNIVLNLVLMRIYDVQGIALSTTLTLSVITTIFFLLLKKRLAISSIPRIFSLFPAVGISLCCMIAAGAGARLFLGRCDLPLVARLAATAAGMIIVYGLVLLALRKDALQNYLRIFKKTA